MKRPAAGAHEVAKKLRTADPNTSKIQAVSGALKVVGGYPQDILNMLADNVKVALAEPKDVRHRFAEASLAQAEEVLNSEEAGVRANLAELKHKVGEYDAERAARDAKVMETEAGVNEKSEAAKAAQTKLDVAAEESAKAAAAIKEAKHQQQHGDAALAAMTERTAKVEAVYSGSFADATGHPSAKAAKAFVHAAKHFDFDANLLKAAEETLAKKSEERSTFDALVVRELNDVFQAVLAAAAGALAAGEPAKAEQAANMQAATEALAARVAEHEADQVIRDEAKAAHAAAMAAHRVALHAVKDLGPEMKRATLSSAAAAGKLGQCLAIQATFGELRNRITPPPAPAAAVEEPVAVAV